MKSKLTDTGIRSYQPRAAQYSIGDAACPGLCSGHTGRHQVVCLAYRNKGTGKVTWLRSAATRTCRCPGARIAQRRPQDRASAARRAPKTEHIEAKEK
jgi:hypothetical protein